jgi:hypothetical protein
MSGRENLLHSCADMHLVCDDGRRIPCVRYNMATHCSTVRHVLEDTSWTSAAPAPEEIPVHGVSSGDLAAAVEVLHWVGDPFDAMDLQTTTAAMRGMDFLGCSMHDETLAERLWKLVEGAGTLEVLRAHAETLLRRPSTRLPALKRAIVLGTPWPTFKRTLEIGFDGGMDVEAAAFVLREACHMYPMPLLAKTVLGMVPGSVLTFEASMRVLGVERSGIHYHPSEVEDLLRMVVDRFPGESGPAACFLRTARDALGTHDVAPKASVRMHGSVLTYDDMSTASVLLRLHGAAPARGVVVASWLTAVHIDRRQGTHDALVHALRIDGMSGSARGMRVRVMALAGQQTAELWYRWNASPTGWSPLVPTRLSRCRDVEGDARGVRHMLQHSDDVVLRFDLFYGSPDVTDYV